VVLVFLAEVWVPRQFLAGHLPLLVLPRQRHLLLGGEQGHAGHFLQVEANGVIAGDLAQVKLRVNLRLRLLGGLELVLVRSSGLLAVPLLFAI